MREGKDIRYWRDNFHRGSDIGRGGKPWGRRRPQRRDSNTHHARHGYHQAAAVHNVGGEGVSPSWQQVMVHTAVVSVLLGNVVSCGGVRILYTLSRSSTAATH